MKKLILIKIKLMILIFTVIFVISSCSDDPTNPNINQNSGEQTTTPIGTPTGTPVTAAIGSAGGTIISADSTVEVVIPAGALNSSTVITLQPIVNFCFNGHGDALRLTPEGQQFLQPVTIKFHYTDEVLSSTFDILMGIAMQDGTGRWHYFNNVTNDTINRVISLPLSQFGYPGDNSSGGGDISFFDIAHIEPRYKELNVSETAGMTVTYVALPGESDDGLTYLPQPIQYWYVNGEINGTPTFGTIINRQGQSATYKAPAQVPSPNTVMVGALINTRFNHRGRPVESFLLQAVVKIKSNTLRFHLKINESANWFSFAGYACTLTDGVDMDIVVNNTNNTVTVSSVLNRFPNVSPPGGTTPDGSTVTWIAGSDRGHVHVVGYTAFIFTLNGRKYFSVTLNHSDTKNPLFHVVPPSGPDYFVGGEPTGGEPPMLTFVDKDSNQTQVSGNFTSILTSTP